MALRACCRLTIRAVRLSTVAAPRERLRCLQHVPAFGRTSTWVQTLCSASQPEKVVTYEQLKKVLVDGSVVLIDVREPWELREYGSIPGSINVPLQQVKSALQLEPEDFKRMYGGDMPAISENIVFSCLAGVRSIKALQAAVSLGYANAQHYPGGWKDWAEKEMPMKY